MWQYSNTKFPTQYSGIWPHLPYGSQSGKTTKTKEQRLYSNFCPSLGTHAYIGTWSLKSYLFWHTSSVYVPIYQCQSAYFVTVWEKLTITINLSIPSSNTHRWYKSTYFSKLGKHNSGGDSSQHTFGWRNSVIPMGDTSQHTFQTQENTIVVVIQVSIVLD